MKKANMIAMAFASGALLITAGGCEESKSLEEQARETQNKATEMAGDAVTKAREGWDSIKTQYAPQIDELSSKVATLKSEAAEFKDTQLDGFISQLDSELADIKAKLGESFSAEGFASLKEKIGPWMEEAKSLYARAAARLAELAKGATAPAGG